MQATQTTKLASGAPQISSAEKSMAIAIAGRSRVHSISAQNGKVPGGA